MAYSPGTLYLGLTYYHRRSGEMAAIVLPSGIRLNQPHRTECRARGTPPGLKLATRPPSATDVRVSLPEWSEATVSSVDVQPRYADLLQAGEAFERDDGLSDQVHVSGDELKRVARKRLVGERVLRT
jgi:hypothetical protein